VDGEYGPELQARFDGGQGMVEVRHIGIDGPRWFVHGVYFGAAAVDPDQAGPLQEALRGLVVERGSEARPVKELLPLRLPAEAAAQLAELVANEKASAEIPPDDAAGASAEGAKSTEPGDQGGAATARGGGTATRRGRGGRPQRTASETS
jgi:hypothetical protein